MDNARELIVKQIIEKCQEKEVRVTRDLVSFLLSLLQLNPAHRHKECENGSVENIIEEVVNKLCDQTKPSLFTLKSQLYFGKHYYQRDDVIKRHRLALHQKTRPLVMEIIEAKEAKTDEDFEKLYEKIVVVITLLSGLGNPTNPSVLREVSMALQSVFQPSELSHYASLPRRLKEEQLMELMCIVAGIRLFNRDCQRDGEGIDDLPKILREATDRTRKSILDQLDELTRKISRFTAVVENATFASLNDERDSCRPESKSGTLPRTVARGDAEWSIEMLTACRQQEVYIRQLLEDVEQCEDEVKTLVQCLKNRFLKLHDTVRYRTAIPTLQPQFIDLTDIWMSFQDEVIVLSDIDVLLRELISLGSKTVNVDNQTVLESLVEGVKILSDAERRQRFSGELIKNCGECSIYYPNTTKDFNKIKLELLGFCPWMFVVGKGALIPGNPNSGIAKWRGKFYAFSSNTAAEEFGNNPDRCIYDVLKFVRCHPEYVHLFKLHDDIEALKWREVLTDNGPQLKTVNHQTVQTDTHILPPLINPEYTSNIWELRRRALHLASVSGLATRATQTHLSHFRRGVGAQAAPARQAEAQTGRDNSTNTKKPKSFVFGLRGRRDGRRRLASFLEADDAEQRQ